jgi:hypothetical protein
MTTFTALVVALSAHLPGAPGRKASRVIRESPSTCSCGEGAAWFVSEGSHHGADCGLYQRSG